MEAAALVERVLRVRLPQLEFRFSSRLKAGYGVQAIAQEKMTMDIAGKEYKAGFPLSGEWC